MQNRIIYVAVLILCTVKLGSAQVADGMHAAGKKLVGAAASQV